MKKSREYKELTLLGGQVETFPEKPEKNILENSSNFSFPSLKKKKI